MGLGRLFSRMGGRLLENPHTSVAFSLTFSSQFRLLGESVGWVQHGGALTTLCPPPCFPHLFSLWLYPVHASNYLLSTLERMPPGAQLLVWDAICHSRYPSEGVGWAVAQLRADGGESSIYFEVMGRSLLEWNPKSWLGSRKPCMSPSCPPHSPCSQPY